MTDTDVMTDVPRPRTRQRLSATTFLLQALALSVPAALIAWMLRALVDHHPTQAAWTLEILIAVGMLFAAYWSTFHCRRAWSDPMRKLIRAIQDIREKEAPIEELSTIEGGIAQLVPVIQDLLRDLKQQKTEVAKLEHEMRQRVAVRTDALERKIGSLQVQATRDSLTGLLNRRALEQELPRVVSEYKAGGPGACVLMIDVDYFKQLNDTLGHAAGDQLLREIGQLIRSTIRDEDIAFRCGGDEFVVLLQGCSFSTGQAMAERLESLVEGLTKPLRVAQPPRLSIGACALSELDEPTAESLLQTADKRLYAVKTARKQSRSIPTPARRVG